MYQHSLICMKKLSKVSTIFLIIGISVYLTNGRPTESTPDEPSLVSHKETSEVGLSNHEADTEAQITTTTTSETTTDVDFVDVTTNNPTTAMTPINLPVTNIIKRSASEDTAISSPHPQQEIDPITSFIEKEDDLGAVVDKRNANTVKHFLL